VRPAVKHERSGHPETGAADAGSLLQRRDFLKIVGGGIVVLFAVGDWSVLTAEAQRGRPYPSDPNAYLRIDEDGKITVYTGKIEMGQGVVTSLAQMAAEELGLSLESIHMVMGDTDLCPWDMGTFGSMSTRFFGPALRAAAAEAKAVLVSLAAERLQVPQDELVSENGFVFVAADRGRKVSFGQLAQGQKITRRMEGEVELTPVQDFKVMGKATLRRDSLDKVTGEALYACGRRRTVPS
jgi:nicotinate dehydrogenase subunit B